MSTITINLQRPDLASAIQEYNAARSVWEQTSGASTDPVEAAAHDAAALRLAAAERRLIIVRGGRDEVVPEPVPGSWLGRLVDMVRDFVTGL